MVAGDQIHVPFTMRRRILRVSVDGLEQIRIEPHLLRSFHLIRYLEVCLAELVPSQVVYLQIDEHTLTILVEPERVGPDDQVLPVGWRRVTCLDVSGQEQIAQVKLAICSWRFTHDIE